MYNHTHTNQQHIYCIFTNNIYIVLTYKYTHTPTHTHSIGGVRGRGTRLGLSSN